MAASSRAARRACAAGVAGAVRRRCRLHAVEFPDAHSGAQDCGTLAAGCSIIIEASEETPGGAVDWSNASPMPPAGGRAQPGVRRALGSVRASDPEESVKKISFTGSIPVGKHLAGLAAKGMKKATIDLAAIHRCGAFDDADPEEATNTIAAFKYRNAGQVLHLADAFLRAGEGLQRIRRPLHRIRQGPENGRRPGEGHHARPLANPRRLDAMESFVGRRQDRGGKVVTGGSRQGNRFFFQPTVITGARRFQDHDGRAVRAGRADRVVQDLRRSGRARQLAAIRARRLRLHHLGQTAAAIGDAIQSGMVGVNERRRLDAGDAVRRHQGEWLRLRGRHGGPAGLHEREVHLAG